MLTTPIYNDTNLLQNFIIKRIFVVKCYNYLDLDADFEFNPMTNIYEVNPGLTLITKKNNFLTPLVEDDIFFYIQ